MRSELLLILPLDGLHLVFEPQLQLLEADFLKLFVFAEITFLGERFESSGLLHVLLSQPTELVVAAQESVLRSQHSADLQTGIHGLRYHSTKIGSMPNSGAVSL